MLSVEISCLAEVLLMAGDVGAAAFAKPTMKQASLSPLVQCPNMTSHLNASRIAARGRLLICVTAVAFAALNLASALSRLCRRPRGEVRLAGSPSPALCLVRA
jgi:hypothetical protein